MKKQTVINLLLLSLIASLSLFSCRNRGCTDPFAMNYDPEAVKDDGSCTYGLAPGCTDTFALNYEPGAETDDGNCELVAIYGYYSNPNGNAPVLEYDQDSTSELLTYSAPTITLAGNFVDIVLENIGVSDDQDNYRILDLRMEEKDASGQWIEDKEFSKSITEVTQVGVVLVLDNSLSLGDDFLKVKQFAKESAALILNTTQNEASIGIVAFSTKITSFAPTHDLLAIHAFIDSLKQDTLTALYDAVHVGLDLLTDPVFDKDAKSMITFTDGRDNNSVATFEDTKARIENLQNERLKSYTIGLRGKGNLVEQVLEDLAIGGKSAIVDNSTQLQTVFSSFSRDLSNVYRLTYRRSSQVVTEPVSLRFAFYVEMK